MAFLRAVLLALRSVIFMMEWTVLLRVIFELFVSNRHSLPVRFIVRASEPLLIPVRKLLAHDQAKKPRIDLSPLVVIILLYLVNLALRQFMI